MREQGGFLWPDSDRVGASAILDHAGRHFPAVFAHIRGFGLAVQAGGNVGVYPKHLAGRFGHVHTFEPAVDNFTCLTANLAGADNVITVHQAALGAEPGRASLAWHADNAGAHRLAEGDDVAVETIDGLVLPACDLIWLDIEGGELAALKGAVDTIMQFRPVVIVEDMGIGGSEGAARAWLERRFGYRQLAKLKHDYVMAP